MPNNAIPLKEEPIFFAIPAACNSVTMGRMLQWYGQLFRFLSRLEAVTAFCGNSRMSVLGLNWHSGYAKRKSCAIVNNTWCLSISWLFRCACGAITLRLTLLHYRLVLNRRVVPLRIEPYPLKITGKWLIIILYNTFNRSMNFHENKGGSSSLQSFIKVNG